MSTVQKNTTEQRTTICVFRGLSTYKREINKRLRSIQRKTGEKQSLESLLERGLNLILAEHDEPPVTGRLQGRYSKK